MRGGPHLRYYGRRHHGKWRCVWSAHRRRPVVKWARPAPVRSSRPCSLNWLCAAPSSARARLPTPTVPRPGNFRRARARRRRPRSARGVAPQRGPRARPRRSWTLAPPPPGHGRRVREACAKRKCFRKCATAFSREKGLLAPAQRAKHRVLPSKACQPHAARGPRRAAGRGWQLCRHRPTHQPTAPPSRLDGHSQRWHPVYRLRPRRRRARIACHRRLLLPLPPVTNLKRGPAGGASRAPAVPWPPRARISI